MNLIVLALVKDSVQPHSIVTTAVSKETRNVLTSRKKALYLTSDIIDYKYR